MPDVYSLAIALTVVASLGGVGLLIASAFVRRGSVHGGVYCFGAGLVVMHSGNFARTWLENLHNTAEWQPGLETLTAADRARMNPSLLDWMTERAARPAVDWLDWTLLGVAVLFGMFAVARPEWLMLPQDRVKLGLGPVSLRFGGAK